MDGKFTQEDIDMFKTNLQIWFEDYKKDGCEGEWESQLLEVFKAGYGESFRDILST